MIAAADLIFSNDLLDLQFDEIQVLTKDSGVSAVKPNYVFEVNYSEAANTKFQDVRKGRELLYAYHGSRLENFHSILHHGLASHMNKVRTFICKRR